MASGDKDLTFSLLLDKFYAKAAEIDIQLKPKLDFMLNISENVNEIDSKFQASQKKLLNYEQRVEVLGKVPKGMIIKGVKTRGYLCGKLAFINDAQNIKKLSLYSDIVSAIAFKPLNKYDKEIGNSFEKWIQNPVDAEHIQRVMNHLEHMKSKYGELNKKFIEKIDVLLKVKTNIGTDMLGISKLFEKLLKTSNSEHALTKFLLEEIVTYTAKIFDQQIQTLKTLVEIRETLDKYNEQRVKWAEYLIGMRNWLPSFRVPLKLVNMEYVKTFSKILQGKCVEMCDRLRMKKK